MDTLKENIPFCHKLNERINSLLCKDRYLWKWWNINWPKVQKWKRLKVTTKYNSSFTFPVFRSSPCHWPCWEFDSLLHKTLLLGVNCADLLERRERDQEVSEIVEYLWPRPTEPVIQISTYRYCNYWQFQYVLR